MNQELSAITSQLRALANTKKGLVAERFFKTGVGQYGHGDQFLGVTVPQTRSVMKAHRDATWGSVQALLKSPIHEERLLALLIMVDQYQRGDDRIKAQLTKRYCANLKYVNNWDLVDSSADKILGAQLLTSKQSIALLKHYAVSPNLWKRRVAIIATFAFIKAGQFKPTLDISTILLHDTHDLIHKAVGWMLREMGKRDEALLKKFLQRHYKVMPRTMLRYAIEKFPKQIQRQYRDGTL